MPERRVLLGVIGRPHGVRGLVRVASHTEDPDAIAEYGPLDNGAGRRFVLRWRGEGLAAIAELVEGREVPVTDRDAAARLTNTRLYIDRDRLPQAGEDEFYLADLIGLAAQDEAGAVLGSVAQVHDYGAGTSLEIARPGGAALLVPFTRVAVPVVDVPGGHIVVVPPEEIVGEITAAPSTGSFPQADPERPAGSREIGA